MKGSIEMDNYKSLQVTEIGPFSCFVMINDEKSDQSETHM